MSPFLLTLLLTFCGTTLIVGGLAYLGYEAAFGYRSLVKTRIRQLSGKAIEDQHTLLFDLKALAETATAAPGGWRTRMRDIVEQSGVRLSLNSLYLLTLGSATAMALVGYLLSRAWWGAAICVFLGLPLPWLFVLLRRRMRLQRLIAQLPDALDVICRGVRAGQTVPATFQIVADDFPPPISDEFRHCYELQNFGISYETSLRNLAQSTGIMELRILVAALLVQSRSGGRLTELLQNLSSMVRKRLLLQQKVRALTGEGRIQAIILIALPFLVFAACFILNRDYILVLLDRPWILVGCVTSQLIGSAIICRMIQIEY